MQGLNDMGNMMSTYFFVFRYVIQLLYYYKFVLFLLLQNVKREPVESRWRPGSQGRGSRGGRSNFLSRYTSHGKQMSDKLFSIIMSWLYPVFYNNKIYFAAFTWVCFRAKYTLLWLAVVKFCNLFSNSSNCTTLLCLSKQIFLCN